MTNTLRQHNHHVTNAICGHAHKHPPDAAPAAAPPAAAVFVAIPDPKPDPTSGAVELAAADTAGELATLAPSQETPMLYGATGGAAADSGTGAGDEEAGTDASDVAAASASQAAVASQSESFGYLLMFLSTFGYSSMTLLLRVAESRYAVSPLSAVFLRAVVQTTLAAGSLIFATPAAAVRASFTGSKTWLLALRGLLGALSMACLFGALSLIPAGDASAIYFVSPIFTMLLSHRVLGEPISGVAAGAALVSFAGTALVTRPGAESVPGLTAGTRVAGSLLALASAGLSAATYVLVRALGTGVHYMVSVLSLGVFALLVSMFGAGAGAPLGVLQSAAGAGVILASAFAGFVGQMSWNKGLQHCPAGPGALIRNIDVPMVYALGLFVLGEKLEFGRVVGALLVVGSATAVGVNKLLRGNSR